MILLFISSPLNLAYTTIFNRFLHTDPFFYCSDMRFTVGGSSEGSATNFSAKYIKAIMLNWITFDDVLGMHQFRNVSMIQ